MDQRLGHGIGHSSQECCGNELSERSLWRDKMGGCVHERCGMGLCANRVKCDVVEWVERNTLRWFDHIERKNSEEFVEKKVYE